VLDFVYVIGVLDEPTNPRSLADGLIAAEPQRRHAGAAADVRATPLGSEERLDVLRTFNYLPRLTFTIDMDTRLLIGRDDVLTPHDPMNTGVPFAIDGRTFPTIVSEEFSAASDLLRSAVEEPGYRAFDPDVLKLTHELIDHELMKTAEGFAAELDRYLRLEDMSDAVSDYVTVSFVVDDGPSIGVQASAYRDFVGKYLQIRERIAT
jgi:hypothetical protein